MPRVLQNIEIINEKPRKLLQNVLPTTADVLRAIQYVKRTSEAHEKIPWKTIERDVAKEVLEIWNRASIPTTHCNQLVKKTIKLNQDFLALLNADNMRKDKPHYIRKVNTFRVSSFRLSPFCFKVTSNHYLFPVYFIGAV